MLKLLFYLKTTARCCTTETLKGEMAIDKFLVVVLTVGHYYKLRISTKFYEGFDSSLPND